MARVFNPVYSSLSDGTDITLCRILEAVSTSSGGATLTSANTAVASDGVTRVPLNLDDNGRLIVDIGSSIQLDSLSVNTDQVEAKQDTSNALLTTIQADLAGTLNSNATLTGIGSGVTLPVSGSFYPSVQPVSLVGDSLQAIPASLTAAVSIAGGQSVSLSGGLVTLNGSNATLPVSGNFYQATQPISGSLTATAYGSDSLGTLHQLRTDSLGDLITARTWNLAQGTDTLYASLGSQSLAVTGTFYQATQPVSGTVSLGAGASSGTLVAGAFNKASGTGTISGGSVTAGTPASLPFATKTLSILNNSASGVLYVSTSTLPSATNGLALAAGAGYDLSYIISSTIYVNASTGTVNYGVVYA